MWQEKYDCVLKLNYTAYFIHNYNKLIYDSLNVKNKNLLVVNDQMTETHYCNTLVKLFTKGLHNQNLRVIYFVHNLFNKKSILKPFY